MAIDDETQWEVVRHEGGRIHVLPIDDDHEHVLSVDCPCRPKVDEVVRGVVVHNSSDGRERFENLPVM